MWTSWAVRPVPETRNPKAPSAPSSVAEPSGWRLLLPNPADTLPLANGVRPIPSGRSGSMIFTTPPSAFDPYRTLAGPRMTSIREEAAGSTLEK